jgi:hypothetical protein
MSSLVRAGNAEKSADGEGEEVVGDPDVLQRGGPERVLHCSTAGNGRASHQALWACGWWCGWSCRAPSSCLDWARLVILALDPTQMGEPCAWRKRDSTSCDFQARDPTALGCTTLLDHCKLQSRKFIAFTTHVVPEAKPVARIAGRDSKSGVPSDVKLRDDMCPSSCLEM